MNADKAYLKNRKIAAVIGVVLILVLAACQATGPADGAPDVPQPSAVSDDAFLTVQAAVRITLAQTTDTPAPPAVSEVTVTPPPTLLETASPAEPTGTSPGITVAEIPDPALFSWESVVSGLERVTALVDAGGGQLLALEQAGRIRSIRNGQIEEQVFLDIRERVGSGGNEQGLLGIALHPDYASNRYFYVNYTDRAGTTVIARFTANAGVSLADSSGEKVLLTVDQPYANHNGGAVAFGPDGYLYLGLGDGGSGGDPLGNGQKLSTLLGKILRIDVDNGDPYAIPADNPFADGQGGRAEIWAYGLRNPWRFSFDRLTGSLYIADVGQNRWEEIDYLPAGAPGGANFGWNYREGLDRYEGMPPEGLAMIDPVAQYPHPEGCSVTGGYVYRGAALPELNGVYLYGDYCTGRVWGLLRQADGNWQNQQMFETGAFITSFGEDGEGELYLLDQRSGTVLKLVRAGE